MLNDLEQYFNKNQGRQIYKWPHYFEIYEKHFNKFRNKQVALLEFGVYHGGSLQMWKHYFGPKAKIIGVDIEPRCKELEEKQIEIIIGDQEDRVFLKKLRKEIHKVDIVIDDGGHTMNQQINSFEEIWPIVNVGGVYLVEDLHTSYIKKYGGRYKKQGTFIEFGKKLVDQLNAWQYDSKIPDKRLTVDKYTKSIKSISTYPSVMVFEKAIMHRQHDKKTGKKSGIKFKF
jgi:hypothetical protein